jgi:hypothetical protein
MACRFPASFYRLHLSRELTGLDFDTMRTAAHPNWTMNIIPVIILLDTSSVVVRI